MDQGSPELKNALFETIQNQLEENNPPAIKQTYMRLLGEGISKENVYIYLAQALSCELYDMMKKKRLYNEKNYTRLLEKLPNLDKSDNG